LKGWGRPATYLIVCLLVAALIIVWVLHVRELRLHGLLVDLEFDGPDPSRHSQLREALTVRLAGEVGELRNYRISLDQIHFSEFDDNAWKSKPLDFLVLSPQSTPWYMYKEEAGRKLRRAKKTLRNIIAQGRPPVLAICGGHQFLALAFGGRVDFIDPRFVGKYPDQYPREARGERGVVELETLAPDPIFQGVTTHPGRFRVVQSHHEEVKTVPRPFVNLARSQMSEIQILRAPGKPVYGVAFHPERGWDANNRTGEAIPEGKRILANFFLMAARAKK